MKVYLPRIMSLSQNPASHESEEEQGKSLQSVQQAFIEKAFCIVGEEMKAKMEALGLDENDISEISFENKNHEFLELIDIYFSQLSELKEILEEKYIEEHQRLSGDMSKEDFKKMIDEEVKSDLTAKLSYHNSLGKLFADYGGKWQQVINKRYFRDFSHLVHYSSYGEKYQFDFDLAVEFFELAEEVERERKGGEDRFDMFDGICDAYDNLYEKIKNPELFNDILKLCISTGKSDCKYILKALKDFDIPRSDIEMLGKHYHELMNLGIIAGKNSSIIFSYPSSKLGFLNGKNKDLIIAGLEKLGPDFIYVLNSNSGFINHILERFPERFIEFCENLKKLADYSQNNEGLYLKSLEFVTQFVVDHPDNWEYLLKIGEIFGKNIPGIFSIGKGFINELFEYFPEDYEEILLEVRDIGEHIHGGNEGNFLTYGLRFLAQFLEEGKEKFMEVTNRLRIFNDEKLKQNHNTGGVFFEDGLDLVSRYIRHSPDVKDGKWIEISERIIKIINKHYSNKDDNNANNFMKSYMLGFNQYIGYQLIDEDITLLDELLNFLEKVGGSKNALRLISSLAEIHSPRNLDDDYFDPTSSNGNDYFKRKLNNNAISFTLAYLLKHKKSRILPFIQNLNLIKDLNLGININQVLLGGVSLECKSNEELQELFAGENAEDTKIWKYFVRIGGKTPEDVKRWIVQIKQAKKIDKTKAMPYLIKIQNAFAESLLDYFEKIIHQKIHLKFKKEFGLSKDFEDALINENLLEFYKMYSSTRLNKKQAFELIQKYLNGKVYVGRGDILKMYPYNRAENKDFLETTFKDKTSVWLSRNEEIYDIEETSGGEEKTDNIPERIAHHLKVANDKLELLEIKDNNGNQIEFTSHGKLIDYFDTKIKKDKEKYNENLFADLEFQINAIKKLLKANKAKKVSKIKIYHELEPLKIAMMGNWVDGSCLSYYSTVGNYWSAITNALEVNKGVFYIEDEQGKVIARVLVGVNDNGDLDIHPMYLKGNVGINLKEIFYFQYMSELASKLGVTKHGDRDNVKLLFCDNWYSGD